jgi:hypothetical protein
MLRIPKALKTFQTPSHARAPRQEKELAQRLGGKRVNGSGCGFEKGDVRVKGVLRVEAKTTKNKSFSVTTEMFSKIDAAAAGAGEIPAMVIELDGGRCQLAVVPVWALELIRSM